eukprot:11616005-Prorocentrum_lima.AAC.1
MSIVDEARQKHDKWLLWIADERAKVESSYCYGDRIPFPVSGTVLESHLRIELMEAMPKHIQHQCKTYG